MQQTRTHVWSASAFAALALVREIFQHPDGTTAPSLAYFSISSSPTGWTGFAMALVIGGFLFGGWEAPLLFSEESKNPNLSPGRAAIVGVIATEAWYLLLFIVFQGVDSVKNLGEHGADVLGYASTLLAPDPIARLLPLAVFSALFAATQMQLTEASRVMFSMAQDGLLPKALAALHPRFRTPWVAALILGVLPPLVLIPYLASSEAGTVIVDIIGSVGLFYLAMYTVIPLACVIYAARALRGQGDFWTSSVPPLIGGVAMFLLFIYGLVTLPPAAAIVAGIALAICIVLGIVSAVTSKAEYFKHTDVATPSAGEVLAGRID